MRKIVLLMSILCLNVLGFLLAEDIWGFLPSLPKNLATCENDTFIHLVSLHYHEEQPVDSLVNVEYDSKYADLLESCMAEHGYVIDSREKTRAEFPNMPITYSDRMFLKYESSWHRRWFWQ